MAYAAAPYRYASTLPPTPAVAAPPVAGLTAAAGPRPVLSADRGLYDKVSEPFPVHATPMASTAPRLESLITAMTRSMHLQPSALSNAFFSSANLNVVQNMVRDAVKRRTGYSVDRQSDDALLSVMRHVYMREGSNMNPKKELPRLNAAVVAEAAPIVASGLAQFLSYVRDASQLPSPLARAQQTSIKGNKTTDLFRPL